MILQEKQFCTPRVTFGGILTPPIPPPCITYYPYSALSRFNNITKCAPWLSSNSCGTQLASCRLWIDAYSCIYRTHNQMATSPIFLLENKVPSGMYRVGRVAQKARTFSWGQPERQVRSTCIFNGEESPKRQPFPHLRHADDRAMVARLTLHCLVFYLGNFFVH